MSHALFIEYLEEFIIFPYQAYLFLLPDFCFFIKMLNIFLFFFQFILWFISVHFAFQ